MNSSKTTIVHGSNYLLGSFFLLSLQTMQRGTHAFLPPWLPFAIINVIHDTTIVQTSKCKKQLKNYSQDKLHTQTCTHVDFTNTLVFQITPSPSL